MEDLAKRYPFQIPSYFALILRCFSVIEGIALRVDPNYSIVQECFPYLARRLLTDDHPRTRAALRQLLYGVRCMLCPSMLSLCVQLACWTSTFCMLMHTLCRAAEAGRVPWQDKTRLDVRRLQRLTSGFANFTTSGLTTTSPETVRARLPAHQATGPLDLVCASC